MNVCMMGYVRMYVCECNGKWILCMIFAKHVEPGKRIRTKVNEVTIERDGEAKRGQNEIEKEEKKEDQLGHRL